MAAIDGSAAQRLLAASAGLGLICADALHAQAAPSEGQLELQFSRYEEFQTRAARMRINAPSLFVLTPINDQYAAQFYLTTDSMSGASPLYHDSLSGASGEGVEDFRKAGQAAVTRYLEHANVQISGAFSDEDDYRSQALGVKANFDSESRNRTLSVGIGVNRDLVNPTNDLVQDQRKRGRAVSLGLTQILDSRSVLAVGAEFSHGEGYYNDPYKPLDRRPDARDELALSARYHRSLSPSDTVRIGYRYYRDTWNVHAHSLDLAYEKQLASEWALTPSLRWHAQSSADFYAPPPFGLSFRPGFNYSADTRLSSFGALEAALKLSMPQIQSFTPELKFAFYRQRQGLGLGRTSDTPQVLLPSARTWQFNLKRSF